MYGGIFSKKNRKETAY